MRRLLFLAVAVPFVLVAAVFAGPASSGGLGLMLAPSKPPSVESVHGEHRPLHKGGVDLPTGLYVRQNDDLVVQGAPALVLRRTYLSEYRASKQFGIGATHPGEEFLIGDGTTFAWAAVILASGTRIHFNRTSPGATWYNAAYLHDGSAAEWAGARLAWAGLGWALRRRDGSLSLYQGCGYAAGGICSIVQSRDADGHTTNYRRDGAGRLVKIDDGATRWIALEYDEKDRVARAHDSSGGEVRYGYDYRGRLVDVRAPGGRVSRYRYTNFDQLARIEEPGTLIENEYDAGRCIRQVNWFEQGPPLVFEFKYHLEHGRIVRTDMIRSDGRNSTVTFSADRR